MGDAIILTCSGHRILDRRMDVKGSRYMDIETLRKKLKEHFGDALSMGDLSAYAELDRIPTAGNDELMEMAKEAGIQLN